MNLPERVVLKKTECPISQNNQIRSQNNHMSGIKKLKIMPTKVKQQTIWLDRSILKGNMNIVIDSHLLTVSENLEISHPQLFLLFFRGYGKLAGEENENQQQNKIQHCLRTPYIIVHFNSPIQSLFPIYVSL